MAFNQRAVTQMVDPDGEPNFRILPDDDEASDGYASDGSSALTEIVTEECPSYFEERDGRLFHSHGSSPYPLPVDTPEQERLKVQHNVLKRLIGRNYVGPVAEVLATEPGRQKRVLDLCTGSGKWLVEMAEEFPYVQFNGIDIVPIATMYPPPGVQFEVNDVNEAFRWSESTFDVVHARSISMATTNYPAIIKEVARTLRTGGLFLSIERGRYPAFYPFLPVQAALTHIPRTSHFFEVVNRALERRGIRNIAPSLPSILNGSGLFTNVTTESIYVPIGPWPSFPDVRRMGRAFRASLVRYADSVKPMLKQAGMGEVEIEALVQGFVHDLRNVRGMVAVFHAVHARKL